MTWQAETDELARQAQLARQMGGADAVAKHKRRGKLTVRERIELLADPGSFDEWGVLAGRAEWDGDTVTKLTPANSVAGVLKVGGHKAAVVGGDFTIRGGAADGSVADKGVWALKHAYSNRVPLIRLLDAAGGSVRTFETMGRTYLPSSDRTMEVDILQRVPCVSAIMGSTAGLPAVRGVLCHFNVMVNGTSQLFVGGPPVVRTALGLDVTKEELGGADIQVRQSGVVANVAPDEADALSQIRRFLGYMPQSVWQMPKRTEATPEPPGSEEELLSVVPRNPRRAFDPYRVLDLTLDQGSFFEIQPLYGRARITGLARLDGYPVGVMVNNPRFLGGAMNVPAAQKTSRLLQLCDTFHLPVVYFCDEPGFMVGTDSEREGIIRAGARTLAILNLSQMPYITIILRQVYGVAGGLNHRGGPALYRRYAWPSGHWGSMHIEGGVSAAYRKEISTAPDPEMRRIEIEQQLSSLASPFRAAHAGSVEVIDPRQTRRVLTTFVEDAQQVISTQLGPTSRVAYLP